MTRTARRLGALLAAAALLVGAPAAAHAAPAVPAAIDPACADFGFAGYVEVGDPAEITRDLPDVVEVDGMSCVLRLQQPGTEGIEIYAYLTDPFAVFLDTAARFVADGWTVTEGLDDGTEIPADLAGLAERGDDGEISLVFRRGLDGAGLYYATDALEATFGIGTFLAVFQQTPAGGTGIDDPSTISDLRTIVDAIPTPAQGGVLLISAALLTLLLAVPAFLLSRVLAARYDRWFGWLDRGRLGRLREELAQPRSSRLRWIVLTVGILLASLIAAFIDPRFGFNGLSVRLYLTLLVTFAIFNIGAWAVVRLVMRRVQPDARPLLTLHPGSLVVVAVAVALSRLLQFDPGVVFGLVAGTTFAVTLALSREAVVIIAGTAYAAAVALVAWIGYSILTWLQPLDAAAVALTELLGGLTLEGVATLPIALIPLASLDGGILFRWKRWVWAVVYAAGMALFLLVLFDLPGGDVPVDQGFWNWLLVFGVFAVVAIGVWSFDLVLQRRRPSPA
jgi:hypothetical protein